MTAKSTILAASASDPTSVSDEFYAFPLTPAQRAMAPHGATMLSDPRYNGAFRMDLAGAVDAGILERALREIAQRQESLRTRFQVVDGDMHQIVFPISSLALDVVDLRSFPEADGAAMLDELSTTEAQQVFDLSAGSPVRVKLLRIEDTHSVLTFTAHQIVCDGWSIGLLMEELTVTYNAFAEGSPSPLAPLSFEFGDYATWQQDHLASAEVRGQLSYWAKKLAGSKPLHVAPDLSGDEYSPEAGIVSQMLPRDLTHSLRTLSQTGNTTFYVVTMAACMTLLARYTGETDIALRTPLAGRTRVEFEPIIGQFGNQVAIRAQVDAGVTFSVLIERVRESLWEALANQDAPFEEVLASIATSSLPAEALFPINFVCQREYGRNGPSSFQLGGATMTTMPSKSQGALYDLNFFLVEREAGWRMSLEYKRALYSEETAESILVHFEDILRQVAEDPTQPLSHLALSPAHALQPAAAVAEEHPAPTEIIAMPGSLAQERFWTLSQLDPTNPAFHVPLVMKLTGPVFATLLQQSLQLLVDRHESLRTTFAEQDGEFLQIIHPAYPVALESITIPGANEAEKNLHVAKAIQTEIHKPFDLAALPLFRAVLFGLAEQDHVLIVTLHHILADAASAQVIQRELWAAYEALTLDRNHAPAPLAIQYGDFAVWQREDLDSDAMQGHLNYWLNQLSGDLNIINFPTDRAPAYRPTAKGAVQSVLLPEALTRSLKQLAQSNEVTLYVVTLACYAAMLSRASDADDVIIGSPVLNRRTETEALIGPFAGPMALRMKLSSNSTLHDIILAARDRTLEGLDHADLPFELLLRNLTVRAQHERRPLFQFYFLCQAAFVQSRQVGSLTVTPLPSVSVGTPFEMQLALIERGEGLRAELEYSADLFDDSTIERWLAYYLQLLGIIVADPAKRLSELPAPPFKAPPITAHSGQKESSRKSASQPYVAPRDLVEEMVAQVWEGVLGLPSISVHANFFDIGGTSLLILKMVPRINAAFDLVLPVPTIFNAPTIEQMANVLKKRHTIEKQVVLALHPAGTRPPLFMVHSYHLYRALPAALGGDQPFYGVMELELADRRAPYTLKAQVENYVKHIRSVQPKGPYYLAGFCFFGLIAFEVCAQLEALGERVAFLGLIDTYCPEYWSKQHDTSPGELRATASLMPRSIAPLWHHLRKTRGMTLGEKLRAHLEFIGEKLRNQRLSLALESRVKAYTHFISRGIKLPSWLNDPALVTRVGVRSHVPAKIASDIYLFPAEDVPLEADFDPTLGWGGMTTGAVHTLWIPGDHEDMFKEKNVGAMARTIREAMDCARTDSAQ